MHKRWAASASEEDAEELERFKRFKREEKEREVKEASLTAQDTERLAALVRCRLPYTTADVPQAYKMCASLIPGKMYCLWCGVDTHNCVTCTNHCPRCGGAHSLETCPRQWGEVACDDCGMRGHLNVSCIWNIIGSFKKAPGPRGARSPGNQRKPVSFQGERSGHGHGRDRPGGYNRQGNNRAYQAEANENDSADESVDKRIKKAVDGVLKKMERQQSDVIRAIERMGRNRERDRDRERQRERNRERNRSRSRGRSRGDGRRRRGEKQKEKKGNE